ncbi:UDP-N-acetylglucosamine 2-epimerase [Alphaproteobacteria bacterium]|nr:UDP-N-acetylglucosamine 2-epimerase [Alphaproteobacteria bacterium]
MKPIKVCLFTGTRADYPRIKSIIPLLENSKQFDLKIIVTGSHLLKKFGFTYKEIINDGYKIHKKVRMFHQNIDDTLYGNTLAFSNCAKGIAKVIEEIKPDLAIVTVDRVETLAIASACALMNVPIAHIQGGEVSGTIDESIRHAVTKLSHLHFVSTKLSARRIIQMGENKKNVYTVGCPYTDILEKIKQKKTKSNKLVKLIQGKSKYVIFMMHSVTTNINEIKKNLQKLIAAIKNISEDYYIFSFLPNTDPGCNYIIDNLKKNKKIKIIKNLDSYLFLELMKYSQFMIGNSSSGIREAPTFKTPYICIGSRQNGRERSSNVVDCSYNTQEILKYVKYVTSNRRFQKKLKNCKNIYGSGNVAKKIFRIIKQNNINPNLIEKKFNLIK